MRISIAIRRPLALAVACVLVVFSPPSRQALAAPSQAAAAAASSPATTPLQPKYEFVATDGDTEKLLITPDDNAVIGSGPYAVHIWRIDTGRLVRIRTVAYPDNLIQDLKVDVFGKTLAYLVAGLKNEVIFADVASGLKVDVRSGKVLLTEVAKPARGEGSWELEDRTLAPTGVAVHATKNSGLEKVAVCYSSGLIEVLTVSTGQIAKIQTGSPGLRSVEFDGEGRLIWTSPSGYGWPGSKLEAFPNTNAYFTNNHLWMFSVVGNKHVVRDYDAKDRKVANSFWALNTDTVADLKPFRDNQVFAMYESGHFGLHSFEGKVIGNRWAFQPINKEATAIPTTNFASSPSGAIVATARGPVVSVYEFGKVPK